MAENDNRIDDHFEESNLPSYLTLHPTCHPKIVFAGGDLFGRESRSRFDGFLAFAERGAFNWYAKEVLRRNLLNCPYRVYTQPTESSRVRYTVQRDLGWLARQGSRTIGIHAPEDWPRCKTALRATVDWLDAHPDAVDKVFFVDASDDYFHCLGLESFCDDRSVCNPSPSAFETYFEHEFPKVMKKAFGRFANGNGYQTCIVKKCDVVKKMHWDSFPIDFSVGLFYTVLVPQAIAKISGQKKDFFTFVKISQWPIMDRIMGGYMAPYTFLADTGLLPKTDQETEDWFRLAREEVEYFFRVLIHYIIGGIQPTRYRFHLDDQQIKAVRQEMKKYLDELEKGLKDGTGINNYYLPDVFFQSQV